MFGLKVSKISSLYYLTFGRISDLIKVQNGNGITFQNRFSRDDLKTEKLVLKVLRLKKNILLESPQLNNIHSKQKFINKLTELLVKSPEKVT